MRYALKGDIDTKLNSNLGKKGKAGRKDMNKILRRASNSLKIKKGGESAITLWDTLTSSIRKAAKTVGRKVNRIVGKGREIGLMCGKEKGMHIKVCINLNWRFPQPRPSPYSRPHTQKVSMEWARATPTARCPQSRNCPRTRTFTPSHCRRRAPSLARRPPPPLPLSPRPSLLLGCRC